MELRHPGIVLDLHSTLWPSSRTGTPQKHCAVRLQCLVCVFVRVVHMFKMLSSPVWPLNEGFEGCWPQIKLQRAEILPGQNVYNLAWFNEITRLCLFCKLISEIATKPESAKYPKLSCKAHDRIERSSELRDSNFPPSVWTGTSARTHTEHTP